MKIPMIKQPDNIFTNLRNTIPFLYYCFKRSSRCMKSKTRLMNRKQKKQARAKMPVDWTRMLITRRGAIMETWSDRKLLYSVKKRTMDFCEGVSSARNWVRFFLPPALSFIFKTLFLRQNIFCASDVLGGAELRTFPDVSWTLQNLHICSLILSIIFSLNETSATFFLTPAPSFE